MTANLSLFKVRAMKRERPTDAPLAGGSAGAVNLGGVDPTTYERRWKILAVLCLSLVLIVAGNSSLNVALPTLVRDLGATQTELQWIVDAYALVFAGLLLPAGALGDRYGRKGALQVGLVIFMLGALLAAISSSPAQLIAFRALMGVGAAFVMPSTLSLLSSAFPPRERAKAIAIWAGFAGAGGAIGPILSGLLLERFWWGSVFFVNIPIALLALGLGAVLVPTSRDTHRRPLDVPGALYSVMALGGLLFGIIEGPEQGWTSPLVLAGFAVGVVGSLLFAHRERTTDHPMLDLSWFGDRRFSIGSSTIALAFFAFFGMFFLLTQYLQFVQGWSPLKAGVATLPMAVSMVIAAPRSATFVERFGPRKVMTVGLVLVASSLAIMSTFTLDTNYGVIAVALVLLGLGGGSVMPPSTGQIMSALPLDRAGVGSAVNDTTREVGGSIGIAVLGSITSVVYRSNIAEALAGLPEQAREVAQESVGAALQFAAQAPDPLAAAEQVRMAFTDAMSWAFLVAALATLVNAVIVWRFAPRVSMVGEVSNGNVPSAGTGSAEQVGEVLADGEARGGGRAGRVPDAQHEAVVVEQEVVDQ